MLNYGTERLKWEFLKLAPSLKLPELHAQLQNCIMCEVGKLLIVGILHNFSQLYIQ